MVASLSMTDVKLVDGPGKLYSEQGTDPGAKEVHRKTNHRTAL